MPDPVTAVMGGSALLGASSANKAAKAQTNAAANEVALARETRDLTRTDLAPYVSSGNQAQAALAYENGLAAMPEGYGGYTKTPGYDFRLQQGQDSLDASAASRGGLFSGASMKAATQYGQDYATNDYGNYYNRLAGMASSGQNAAAGLAAANQNYSNQAGNAYGNIGNAQAAGAIGVGNAIQGGINNGIGLWQYQNTLAGQGGGSLAPSSSMRPMARPY